MEHISELLTGLTGVLESQVRTQITNNWPATPMAIIYANEKAYEAHVEIETTLHHVWRGRADAICKMVIRNGEYYLPLEDHDWQFLSNEDAAEQIDELFAQEQSFRTMNELFLVLIQNTADYTDVEQFETGYISLDEAKNKLGISVCNTMKIVLLDESGKRRALASQIRTYLRESMCAGEATSSATVILSNRLKNGVLLAGNRIRENYFLAGDLILLANNSSNQSTGTFTPKYSSMFPISDPHFVTASYAYGGRPNKAICEVLINATLSWLEGRFNKGELLSMDLMSKKLEITGGSMKTLDRFFHQYIADRLPPREVLEYLPRTGVNLGPIGDLPFREYDRITMGGFKSFYESTVLPLCTSERLKHQFRDYFMEQIRGIFTPNEAARSITVQTVEQVLNQLRQEGPSEARPAGEYMIAMAKQEHYKTMLPICEEVLLNVGATAREHIKKISELSEEFQHSYMLDIDNSVQRFYHELATTKLEEEYGEQLLEIFDRSNLTKTEVLTALDQTIKLTLSSHSIFGMSMVKELIMRMGGNANMVRPIIQELTDDLGDSIRLQTTIVPEVIFKTMLVDKHEVEFYDLLKTLFSNADSLDTGNSNDVEFVQLYAIDPHTL